MFIKGNTYGSKGKRGKGKVDTELKTQLKNITKEILDSIKVEELTRTQKITFLKSSLAYLLPKELITDSYISEDVPLFIDDPHKVHYNSKIHLHIESYHNKPQYIRFHLISANKKLIHQFQLVMVSY